MRPASTKVNVQATNSSAIGANPVSPREATRAERMARISHLPENPALRAWAELREPDPADFRNAMQVCLEGECVDVIADIQAEHPSFNGRCSTDTVAGAAAIVAFGIRCDLSLVLESAEDVIQVAEHLEGGTRCAIRSLYVQGNERVPTEAWQQLSCRLPPSVKRVCLSDFGGAEVYVARALPRSVEALTIRGGRGWTPMEREMLLERRELHELTIDGASAGAFVEWANDIATTGRACGVENLCLSRGWIGSHGARDVLTAIRTLVAADTNLMHLQVAGFENVFPAPTLANDQKLAAKMEKNHTLQTIGGVDLPVGVPALLDRNRRALNMAMKVGSNALSQWVEREDRGGTMVETGKCEDQPGGAVLGVVINHIDQKSSDSRDFRNVIRTTFQASSAAEKAAKDIFYPEKK